MTLTTSLRQAGLTLCALASVSVPAKADVFFNFDAGLGQKMSFVHVGPDCDYVQYQAKPEDRSLFRVARKFYGRIQSKENHDKLVSMGLIHFPLEESNPCYPDQVPEGGRKCRVINYRSSLAVIEAYQHKIAELNKLDVSAKIQVGQTLKLPYGGRIVCGRLDLIAGEL